MFLETNMAFVTGRADKWWAWVVVWTGVVALIFYESISAQSALSKEAIYLLGGAGVLAGVGVLIRKWIAKRK